MQRLQEFVHRLGDCHVCVSHCGLRTGEEGQDTQALLATCSADLKCSNLCGHIRKKYTVCHKILVWILQYSNSKNAIAG